MAATTSTASHVQMTSRTAIKNRSCQSLSSHTSDLDSCGESDSAEIPSVAVKAEYEENRGDEETDVGSPIQSALLHNYTRAAGREVGNLFVDTSTVTSQLSQSLVTGGGVANSAIGLHVSHALLLLSIYLYRSIYTSIYIYIYLSIYLSIYTSIYIYLSIYIYVSIYLYYI